MPAQMTSTALIQGWKNALVCGVGTVMFCALAGGAISLATGKQIWESIELAWAKFWVGVTLWFFAAWLHGRNAGGQTLLDCGPHPARKLFVFEAALFLFLGLTGGFATLSVSKLLVFAGPLFGISAAIYWVVAATGRLQVRETGIWAYGSLLPWNKIDSYTWSDDSTLLLRMKGRFSFLGRGALPVPPEQRDAVEQLLQRFCAGRLMRSDISASAG